MFQFVQRENFKTILLRKRSLDVLIQEHNIYSPSRNGPQTNFKNLQFFLKTFKRNVRDNFWPSLGGPGILFCKMWDKNKFEFFSHGSVINMRSNETWVDDRPSLHEVFMWNLFLRDIFIWKVFSALSFQPEVFIGWLKRCDTKTFLVACAYTYHIF